MKTTIQKTATPLEESSEREYGKIRKITETAVEFARMWGIMETLDSNDKLSEKSPQMRTEAIIAWAEEFVTGSKGDMLVFFQEKIREIK